MAITVHIIFKFFNIDYKNLNKTNPNTYKLTDDCLRTLKFSVNVEVHVRRRNMVTLSVIHRTQILGLYY